jgi:catechol 2,3-dioxygenase-like lactoylglutathione lyase family enzyme
MSELVMTRQEQKAKVEIVAKRLHHTARVVKDHEKTRQFYEDVVGLPLIATWAEVAEFPDTPGEKTYYCHAFYGLADGGALAFFGFAKPEVYEKSKAVTQTGFNHLALAVTREGQDEIQARLEKAGYPVRMIDHGYCRSIYTRDPDELNLEFTSDPANAPQIYERQGREAHDTLKRWLAGDLTPNNDLHHR